MDIREDSLKNFNSLSKSEQLALCAYWFDLERLRAQGGLINFITTFQDKASVFDVPESLIKKAKNE